MMRLVVDASCDFPNEFKNDVTVLPMYITMGDKTVTTDKLNEEEFNKFILNGNVPKTSQSSPKMVVDVIKKFDKGDDIIVMTISTKMSGEYNSVKLAMNLLKDYKIKLIDSESASIEYGVIASLAIKAIKDGKSVDEVEKIIEDAKKKKRLIAVLSSLDYLEKGGRIGKAKMFLGKLLGIKPVIKIEDGIVVSYGKNVRGDAVSFLKEEVSKNMKKPKIIVVGHREKKDEFDKMMTWLKEHYNCEIYGASIGPIISTHVGPGIIAVSWIEE